MSYTLPDRLVERGRIRCSRCRKKAGEVVAVARPRPRGVPKKLLRVSQDPIIGFKAAQFASVKTFGVVGQIGSIARPAAVDRSVSARPLRAVPGRP